MALVGIFEADKEGFLRSEKSLIQTIGRAARNSEGRVILYAYKETKSMAKAISETKRRRTIQEDFNTKHGITPTTIIKSVSGGVIETLRGVKNSNKGKKAATVIEHVDLAAIDMRIVELKNEMKVASKELRFEDAAKIRDEIKELTQARLVF